MKTKLFALFCIFLCTFSYCFASSNVTVNKTSAIRNLKISGISPFVTCPIDACLVDYSVGGNVYSPAEIQYITQKKSNEEIGLNVSVLDITGAGSETPGAAISPGGKMAGYFGIMQTPQGGTAWALNTVVTRGAYPYHPPGPKGEPGTGYDVLPRSVPVSIGTIGYEADLNNRDQLASSGKPFVVNLYVAGSSLYTSTAGIFYAGNNGKPSVPLYQYGLMFSGPSAHVGSSVGGVTIEDDSSARMSFHTLGDHSIATINDESSGSRSLWITGTHQQQDIEINTNSPSEIQLDGRPAVAIKINASPKQAIMDTRSAWDHGEGKIIEASSGQRICFNETYACQWYDADSKKWYFTNSSGKIVMSILEDGSINIKGHLNEGKDP